MLLSWSPQASRPTQAKQHRRLHVCEADWWLEIRYGLDSAVNRTQRCEYEQHTEGPWVGCQQGNHSAVYPQRWISSAVAFWICRRMRSWRPCHLITISHRTLLQIQQSRTSCPFSLNMDERHRCLPFDETVNVSMLFGTQLTIYSHLCGDMVDCDEAYTGRNGCV